MTRRSDLIAGLDNGRSALPHRDPTFDAVVERLRLGDLPLDWKITGPRVVNSEARTRAGRDRNGDMIAMPAVAERPVELNLMPEVAVAILLYLDTIAEAKPSRSGLSKTYRLKKKGPVAPASANGAESHP